MIGTILFAASSLLGIGSSLYGAKQASTEAKYNAQMKEKQGRMIDEQIKMSGKQWDRQITRAGGTLIANVAASGIELSGSPLVALNDLYTQMELDKQIEKYNLEWEKVGVQSEAAAYGRQSRNAMTAGYANAFSKTLGAGYDMWRTF